MNDTRQDPRAGVVLGRQEGESEADTRRGRVICPAASTTAPCLRMTRIPGSGVTCAGCGIRMGRASKRKRKGGEEVESSRAFTAGN